MDNFIDKLAQRYNATEMIRANSQAETAQMEGLQEQVEAYEAVLQEMRKLNYKNTELTEKMYSLVDESLEKVRTLQIEASEGGANPAEVSKEMSEAVINALNEAFNNMDGTVARTISESLAGALAQPAEDIKQSAMATESVKEAIENVDGKVSRLIEAQQNNEQLLNAISQQIKENEEKRVKDREEDLENQMAAEIAAEEAAKLAREIAEAASDAENTAAVDTDAEAAKAQEAEVAKEYHEELVRLVETLGNDVFNVNAKLTGIEDMISSDSNRIDALSQTVENGFDNAKAPESAVSDIQIESIIASVNAVDEKILEMAAKDGVIDEKLSSVVSAITGLEAKVDEINAKSQAEAEKKAEIEAEAAKEAEAEEVKENASAEALNQACISISEKIDSSSAQVVASISGKTDEVAAKFDTYGEKISSTDTYVRGIWESIEGQKTAISGIAQQLQQNSENAGEHKESPEMRSAVLEIVNSVDEIKTGMRGIKSNQDSSSSSLKESIDSAIYGLKQDNREIVEFMQRMNSNIVASKSDAEKERLEEEKAKEKEEEKRLMDERFRANEDFMHKESVKVYRNVQAVINEKADRQSDTVETRLKQVSSQISSLKIFMIIAALLSGADLVVQLLRILGIL